MEVLNNPSLRQLLASATLVPTSVHSHSPALVPTSASVTTAPPLRDDVSASMIGSVLQETRGIRRRLASERRSLGCLDVWTGRTLLTIFIGMFVPQSPFRPRTILFSKAALAPRQRFGRVVRGMRWIGHVSQHRFS